MHSFKGNGGATWKIYSDGSAKEDRAPLAWTSFATPFAPDPTTFGFKWNEQLVTKTQSKGGGGALVTLPEYFQRKTKDNKKPEWVAVPAQDVPAATGLSEAKMVRPNQALSDAYVTPDDSESCWKKPGPVAGPFQVRPNDGSVVTYYWYRFAELAIIARLPSTSECSRPRDRKSVV